MYNTHSIPVLHDQPVGVSAVDPNIVIRDTIHHIAPDIPACFHQFLGVSVFFQNNHQENQSQQQKQSADCCENNPDNTYFLFKIHPEAHAQDQINDAHKAQDQSRDSKTTQTCFLLFHHFPISLSSCAFWQY